MTMANFGKSGIFESKSFVVLINKNNMIGRYINAIRLKMSALAIPKNWSTQSVHNNIQTRHSASIPPVVLNKEGLGTVTIRTMIESDLNNVMALIRTRKLIDSSDTDIFPICHCPGFTGVVAELENKNIIGFVSFFEYDNDLTTGGHGVVSEEHRGLRLPPAMIKFYLESRRFNSVLYGYGFNHLKEFYGNINWPLRKEYGAFIKLAGHFSGRYLNERPNCNVDVLEVNKIDFNNLAAYDETIHIKPRPCMLRGMCAHPGTTTYVSVDEQKIVGFGLLRKCYRSYKVAPLFADTPAIAQALYQELSKHVPKETTVSMLVCLNNTHIADFINRNEFEALFSVWLILYPKHATLKFNIDYSKVYSVSDSNFFLC